MPGIIEQVALGLAPWYIKWPVKLLLGAQKAAGAVLAWAGRNPWQAAVIALCALCGGLWWHLSNVERAAALQKAAYVRQIDGMEAASAANLKAQIAQKAAVEQHYKDIANDADTKHAEQLADANDALSRYIAGHRVRGTTVADFSPANSAAQGDGPGVPSDAPAETGLVAVSEANLHVCAADYAYAKSAYDWAVNLGRQ